MDVFFDMRNLLFDSVTMIKGYHLPTSEEDVTGNTIKF